MLFRSYFIGVPFVMVLNMESSILRAVGDSIHPFLFMVAGCVLNILLDALFVIVFHWGVSGVAVATVAAQVMNMALLTVKIMQPGEECLMKLEDLRLKGVYLMNMMRLGVPAGLQSAMYSVSNVLIQVAVNSLGTIVVASWAMSSKTDGIYWAISNALGAAMTGFIAQNYGAGKQDRVRAGFRQGLGIHFGMTVVVSCLLMLLGKSMLRLLTEDAAVVEKTYEIMSYIVPFYFTWSLVEILSAVLRGAGDAVWPVAIIGLGVCLFRIVWIFTAFAWQHTLFILCLSYAISWTITSIALLIYFRKGAWIRARNRLVDR